MMNEMPKILGGDLIEWSNEIFKVFSSYLNHGAWVFSDRQTYSIKEIQDEITAIYRKQGKDYICIWERNKQ